MQARAATFISADKELNTVEDVLAGVGHLIAERFSENAELRGRLRRIFQRSGKIVCTKVEAPLRRRRQRDRSQETGDGSQGTERLTERQQGQSRRSARESDVDGGGGSARRSDGADGADDRARYRVTQYRALSIQPPQSDDAADRTASVGCDRAPCRPTDRQP